ncbi:VOC family protein [Dyella acidisoli]|uniref:Glyoxalase n=1 Tax=Dyella acidisoli TaxID=1867834 RepID=A0ABQ5XRI3_9GAMM|nr:VOC family protein [Dyella acidisoli]GLQ94360.1 hypothetical protein GCM10007901_33120 [Dyella acidisoli]
MSLKHHAFRIYVDPSLLESSVAFYERLQEMKCERRITFADLGIEVAVVGAFMLLAGTHEALAPFRSIWAVLIVDSLDTTLDWIRTQGATVLHEPQQAAGGRHATVRHADGLVAEYYEPAAIA